MMWKYAVVTILISGLVIGLLTFVMPAEKAMDFIDNLIDRMLEIQNRHDK